MQGPFQKDSENNIKNVRPQGRILKLVFLEITFFFSIKTIAPFDYNSMGFLHAQLSSLSKDYIYFFIGIMTKI